jgi:GrpB-like predicted nucleotidyltransferase (UPF0157 family)
VDDANAAGLEFRLVRPGSTVFRLSAANGLSIGFVHVRARDSDPESANLLFRDYLRAHPGVAKEYGRLKLSLAATKMLRGDYSRAKLPFIERAQDSARRWATAKGKQTTAHRRH